MKLELTPNEAIVLYIILERIGGNKADTGRAHAFTMLRKLEAGGCIFSVENEKLFPVHEKYRSIYFI